MKITMKLKMKMKNMYKTKSPSIVWGWILGVPLEVNFFMIMHFYINAIRGPKISLGTFKVLVNR